MPTVLLAEADHDLRDVCLSFLRRQGCQVDTANDGIECLAQLRRFVPDLLILDLKLPWGGGDGVLEMLREQPQFLPNELYSRHRSLRPFDSLASPPFVLALTKPFSLSALLDGHAFSGDGPKPFPDDSRRPAVLVVDDDPAIRGVLQAHLQNQGFHVWTVASGEEALDHCCDHSDEIAVILLDVRMPGLDGPQTLEGIRELDVDIPVCFMTGDPGDYEPNDLLRQGARHVFGKPFGLNEIVRVVRNLANEPVGQAARDLTT